MDTPLSSLRAGAAAGEGKIDPEENSLLPELLVKELTTRWAGRGEIDYQPEMGSTNARLKELALSGAPKGSLALCDLQTAGRGRLQRQWTAVRGQALTHSLLAVPSLPPEKLALCTFAAAVAMAQAIEELCPGLRPGLKWPNDVVLNGKKCVGILSELCSGARNAVVLGVGVNVGQTEFTEELRDKATSLLLELRRQAPTAQAPCRRKLLCAYLRRLEQSMDALEKEGVAGLMPAYSAYSVTLGRPVRVSGGGEEFVGLARALDEEGALLVTDSEGVCRRVLCGDVSVRGIMGYV